MTKKKELIQFIPATMAERSGFQLHGSSMLHSAAQNISNNKITFKLFVKTISGPLQTERGSFILLFFKDNIRAVL